MGGRRRVGFKYVRALRMVAASTRTVKHSWLDTYVRCNSQEIIMIEADSLESAKVKRVAPEPSLHLVLHLLLDQTVCRSLPSSVRDCDRPLSVWYHPILVVADLHKF